MQIVLEFVKITSERALRNIIAGERQEEVYPGPRVRIERLERDSETTTIESKSDLA